MKKLIFIVLPLLLFVTFILHTPDKVSTDTDNEDVKILWGNWNMQELNGIMEQARKTESPGEKTGFISEKFLGTPYVANTLTGSYKTGEVLTIDLSGMDCFTFLDYVESLGLSSNFAEFKSSLEKVRYKDSQVNYQKRRHFFSDWLSIRDVSDITGIIAPDDSEKVTKELNKKSETELYLPDIPVTEREITYIPSGKINSGVIEKLETGDYIGIFTDAPGLDVSHTGIFIRKHGNTYLRHASSKKEFMKVVDVDFKSYVENVPGIVVYRSAN